MFRFRFLPSEVRVLLAGLRSSFRHRHFLIFSWLLTLQLFSGRRSNLKALSRLSPAHVAYWHLRRFLCAGYWWSQSLLAWFVDQVIGALPAPDDGICYLLADSTLKAKRGKHNPAVQTSRQRRGGPYLFGLKIVFLVVHWGNYRLPVDFALIRKKSDPKYKNENTLFRVLLARWQPPAWARQVIVLADSAYASRANLKAIKERRFFFLMALAKTWKFENGKSLKNLVRHTPKYWYDRTWIPVVNSRKRRTYWVFAKRVRLRHLGDVTVVLSKMRPNQCPKSTKTLVTNLPKSVSARKLVALYQRRWNVELLIWELKGATGLGQHQVTKSVPRVQRALAISVLAYLMLIRLGAKDIPKIGPWSAFELKRQFLFRVANEQLNHFARRSQRKARRMRNAA